MNPGGLFEVDWSSYVDPLATALVMTLRYTLVGFTAAIVIGLAVAVLRGVPGPAHLLAALYTEVFKNLPLITEIYIFYFGLASVGIELSAFQAGALSLALFYGAYLSEIFRSGLQSVGPGQREAAAVLGLGSMKTFRYVVVPQAVRVALPGTSTMMVDLLKGTSLMFAIGGGELMTEGTLIVSDTFQAFEVYVVIGLIYLSLCYPLSQLALMVERKMVRGEPLSRRRRRLIRRIETRNQAWA